MPTLIVLTVVLAIVVTAVQTKYGEVTVETPRDRDGSFFCKQIPPA